jgi:hypothetical protein
LHHDSRSAKTGVGPLYRQHNNLVRLREAGLATVYCAPLFFTRGELVAFDAAQALHEHAFCGDPARIGYLLDRGDHHVGYDNGGLSWAIHSELRPLGRPLAWSEGVGNAEPQPFDESSLGEMRRMLAEIAEPEPIAGGVEGDDVDETEELDDGLDELRRLARRARLDYGAALLLIPERPWSARR